MAEVDFSVFPTLLIALVAIGAGAAGLDIAVVEADPHIANPRSLYQRSDQVGVCGTMETGQVAAQRRASVLRLIGWELPVG